MKYFELKLDLDYEKLQLGDGHRATLECYLPSNYEFSKDRKRPAMVICPGGGYAHLSDREAEPIALQYAAADMAAFILRYSVKPDAGFPRCVLEALCAIKTIRENASDWSIDPDKIAICGFSAGGHLAASAGAFWHTPLAKESLGNNELLKPNAAILCYPVISSGPWAHSDSIVNLLGENAAKELVDLLDTVSIEKQITTAYPPTFLWHTATDQIVPVQNTLLMGDALSAANIPFELHIYPMGPHGLALCDERTAKPIHPQFIVPLLGRWVSDSIRFLKEIAFNQ